MSANARRTEPKLRAGLAVRCCRLGRVLDREGIRAGPDVFSGGRQAGREIATYGSRPAGGSKSQIVLDWPFIEKEVRGLGGPPMDAP